MFKEHKPEELSELDDLELEEVMVDHDCLQERCPVCLEWQDRKGLIHDGDGEED